jgi:hypothetical protein
MTLSDGVLFLIIMPLAVTALAMGYVMAWDFWRNDIFGGR